MIDFNTILNNIISYNYDDDRESIKYINSLISSQNKVDTNDIKNILNSELTLFLNKIRENYEKELVILPETDYKYNHWNVLRYILGRHFIGVKIDDIPEYYIEICKITNVREKRSCEELVIKIMTKL